MEEASVTTDEWVKAVLAVPGDPGWCGHTMVDLSTWQCADCGRPVCEEARRRMEGVSTAAPPGWVWVLTEGPGSDYEDDYPGGAVVGVFSDRSGILRRLLRGTIASAAELRARLSRLTWYQGIYNPDCIEAWGTDEDGGEVNYHLELAHIDHPEGGVR